MQNPLSPNIKKNMTTRRSFLKITFGSLILADAVSLFAMKTHSRALWKIGICEWGIRTTGSVSSFEVAKELGFEGVQLAYQPTGEASLALDKNRSLLLETSKESGVGIASLCLLLMNNHPLATTPEAESWVENCIDAMVELNIEQVLVPFFVNADLTQNKDHLPLVIEKLRRLAPIAEKKKKILAIESTLSAEDHIKMLDAIGSNAIKVYYDPRNSLDKNYDIFHEMELLGKNRLISQIHFKEHGKRLGEGDIDFVKVCDTLEKIDYKGWVVVEGSTSGDWKESQIANAQFIKKIIGK